MIKKIVCGDFETNTYIIINDSKCVIVDPGLNFEEAANKIKEEYKVEAILITHCHIDHIDGIRYFDCPVYISNIEAQDLFDNIYSLYYLMDLKNPFKKENLNIIKLSDGEKFELIGKEFIAYLTPGHTRGGMIYSFDNKVFTGDTLFKQSVGRTDFPGGNEKELRLSLKKIVGLVDASVVLYPGHDEKTSMKEELKNNKYLISSINHS